MTSSLVICVHGYPGQAADFAAVGARLANGRKVLAIPMPWTVDCPAALVPPRLDLKQLADFMVAAVRRFGGGEAVDLVAHDIGSLGAWAIAAVQPKAVKSLAILSAPHPGAYRDNLDAIEKGGHRAYIDRLLSGAAESPLPPLQTEEQCEVDLKLLAHLEAAQRKTRRAAVRSLYGNLMAKTVIRAAPDMPPINCPVTLVSGRQDPYFPPQLVEESRRASGPAAVLKILPEAGHYPHLTHAMEVADIVEDHLKAASQSHEV